MGEELMYGGDQRCTLRMQEEWWAKGQGNDHLKLDNSWALLPEHTVGTSPANTQL